MSKKKEKSVILKNRIERFCIEYAKSLKVSQNAINTGYSEKTATSLGSRLLRNVRVISHVREIQFEILNQLPVSIHYVIQGYVDIYYRCIQAELVMKKDYEEKAMLPTSDYIFDSKGTMAALDSIGKYLGMFNEKIKIDANFETKGKLGAI